MKYTVATRASTLAVTQARETLAQLSSFFPNDSFEIKTFKTQGDNLSNHSLDDLTGDGIFVKELQSALLSKKADFAIHSLKDVPSVEIKGLVMAATPKRKSSSDVFISVDNKNPEDIFEGVIGTCSPRRSMQLKLRYPNLFFESIRGNIDTRLNKLSKGKYDGIVLAEAGLIRLSLDNSRVVLPKTIVTPAPGQGSLAIECRSDDFDLISKLKSIHHLPTWICVSTERKVMEILESGCKLPFGANGEIVDKNLSLTVFFGNEKTGKWFKKSNLFLLNDDLLAGRKKTSEIFLNSLLNSIGSWALNLKEEAKQKNILL